MPKINLLKMPDPAAQTAKYVNMMNATKRQEAEERQADAAQKTLKLQQERGAREEALQPSALAKGKTEADVAQLDYVMNFYKATANDIANSSTPDEVVARAERLKQQFPDPALQARVDETVANLVNDPSRFEENRKRILTRTLDAKDQFAVNHSDIFDAEGNLYIKETSPTGSFPTRIMPGVVTGPSVTGAAPAPAPRTPVVPTAAPQQTTPGPVPVGKYGETRVAPDGGQLDDFQQDHVRRMKEELGMTNTPASFTRDGMGQMSPDMVPAILDSAVKTGVMAQIDLDQMLAMTPPQARDGIMQVIRDSKIALQADAPSLAASGMGQQQPMAPNPVQRPPLQFADMRGPPPQSRTANLGGDMAPMQNVMAQYQVGQQIRGKNPSISPAPADIGLSRRGAEARVERASPEEEAAKTRAVGEATAAVEFNKKAAEKLPGRKQVSTLINKVRAAYEQLDKAEAIPSETRGGFANAMDYFGTSSLGREAQKMVGTTNSKYLSEIINSRKLLATAIKNATGMSAQEMNSNVELQLTLDALTDPTQGIEAARTTLATLEELYGAPRTAAPAAAAPRAAAKTPVIPDAAKQMLRKNPSPQQRAFFDRTFGKGAAAKVMGNR
jgi:hypothetical protein